MTTYCYYNNCTSDVIMANFSKNIFNLVGTLNEIAQLFYGEDANIAWTDTDTAFSTYQSLGKNIGKILRSILTTSSSSVTLA